MSAYVSRPPRAPLKCIICGSTHLSRGLCEKHYHYARNHGQLENYPPVRAEYEPPVRESWTYDPPSQNELIVAEERRDAALILLKNALQFTDRLDPDTKKKILAAENEERIRALIEALPKQKRFPYHSDPNTGFLVPDL